MSFCRSSKSYLAFNLLLTSITVAPLYCQTSTDLPAVVHLTSEQDHQRTMNLLHITTIRPGRSGNPQDPNYANYDESRANPWPDLPNALVLNDGKTVKTAKVWWDVRRPQIVEIFDREIYGRVPKIMPSVHWEVVSTTQDKNGDVPIITKKLLGHVDNSAYPLVSVDIEVNLSTPARATGPVPVIMEFGNLRPFVSPPGTPPRPAPPAWPGPTWQQQVLAKGWGY